MTAGPAPAVVAAAVLAIGLACAAYLGAAAVLRRRGDAWPWHRDCLFAAGCAVVVHGLWGPVPGGPFTAHSVRHLLIGMGGPVLLVAARPLTLTLRTLPPGGVRRGLLRIAHSAPAGWLLFPPVAAVVDIGGLWALYRTELLAAVHHRPVLGALLDLHMLAAGLLFTFAVLSLDPVRRRWSLASRAATLLLAGAAHAVLAKSLYATGPPGTSFGTSDLRLGAQVMYYGGDAVEVALAVVLAVQWYAAVGRARVRTERGVRRPRTGRPARTGEERAPGDRPEEPLRASRTQPPRTGNTPGGYAVTFPHRHESPTQTQTQTQTQPPKRPSEPNGDGDRWR
ncbi:cytochrome c oxidase assembly protein [Streptomyces sp. bgisy022]|uniref:cytochrome c oxidase assembly protein n=1 Tax=Streptomyces sp. bgisy022 TaxID=3413769 RepID=UPI003D72CEA3